ncbi:MAG: ParB/RepB/Spo0J family partition protein [Candidatus Freyarchaeota archaeon]
MSLRKVKIEDIVIPEVRARSRWTEEQVQLLRASLGKFGVLQAPLVRPLPNGKYELIDGENRIKTAKEQGLEEIDVYVVEMDDKDASIANIMLNVARGQQDPIGVAVAIKKALDAGATVEEVAKAFNRTPHWVKFMVGLLELPEEYQKALEEGKLNVSHIREATRLPDLYEVDAALQTAIRLNWPATVLKNYVDNRLEQLRRHAQTVEATGVATPPPPPEPEKLVKYGQCLICGRMVPREQIYLPATCKDCYELAQYIVQNVGTGQKAMNFLYQALTNYQAFLHYQQQFMAQKQMEYSGYPPQMPQAMGQNPTQANPASQVSRVRPEEAMGQAGSQPQQRWQPKNPRENQRSR